MKVIQTSVCEDCGLEFFWNTDNHLHAPKRCAACAIDRLNKLIAGEPDPLAVIGLLADEGFVEIPEVD